MAFTVPTIPSASMALLDALPSVGAVKARLPGIPSLPSIPAIPKIPSLPSLPSAANLAIGSSLCALNSNMFSLQNEQAKIKALLSARLMGMSIAGLSVSGLISKFDQIKTLADTAVSFQRELQMLNTSDPNAMLAFANRWGSKIPGYSSIVGPYTDALSKGLNFDFCRNVPNYQFNPTSGAVVLKPAAAKLPDAPPAAVEPVKPTVFDWSTKAMGKLGVTIPQVQKYRTDVEEKYFEIVRPLQTAITEGRATASKSMLTTGYISAQNKSTSTMKSLDILRREGVLLPAEQAEVDKYFAAMLEVSNSAAMLEGTDAYYDSYGKNLAGISRATESYLTSYVAQQKRNDPGIGKYLDNTKALLDVNKATVVNYYKYRTNF